MSSAEVLQSAGERPPRAVWLIPTGIVLVLLAAVPIVQVSVVLTLLFPAYAALAGLCLGKQQGRRKLVLCALVPGLAVGLAYTVAVLLSPSGLFSWYGLSIVAVPVLLAHGLGFATGRSTRSGTTSFVLPALAVLGLAAFALNGISMFWSVPFVFVFPTAAALALWRGAQPFSRIDPRPILAVILAYSATWLGVAWNTEKYGEQTERSVPSLYYETLVVTGFPLQAVEGHGGGGASEWLPISKGLDALVANFVLWVVALLAVAYALPRRALRSTIWVAVVLAVVLAGVSGCLGWLQLLWLLD